MGGASKLDFHCCFQAAQRPAIAFDCYEMPPNCRPRECGDRHQLVAAEMKEAFD
jgi:hypothetical protein